MALKFSVTQIPQPDDKLRILKDNFKTSEFQKSERDFCLCYR